MGRLGPWENSAISTMNFCPRIATALIFYHAGFGDGHLLILQEPALNRTRH